MKSLRRSLCDHIFVAMILTACGGGGGGGGGTPVAPPATTVAPTITTQPAAASVVAPGTATFTVVASGTPSPSYQWQRSTDGGTTFTNIAGATGASYTTAATTTGVSGHRFRVVLSNSTGSATSTAAALSVSNATSQSSQACNIETLSPGVTVQVQSVMVGNPQSTASFTARVIGSATYNGQPATEFELVVTDFPFPGLTTTAKQYSTYDMNTGAATRYGGVVTAAGVVAGLSYSSVVTGVFTPPSVDLTYTLTPGQTVTQTDTVVQTQVDTINGVVDAPATTTETTITTITFVGIEQITVPAGTFSACKYVESIQGVAGTTTQWNHVGTGAPLRSTVSSSGITTQAVSILVGGVPLQ